MPAPVILFTYKRIEQTKKTVEALCKNLLASDSNLHIFSDGPKTTNDTSEVSAIRDYLKSITGFKSVSIYENQENKGLAYSIVNGVSTIIEKYGNCIVLEDDIVTSPYFLTFMNDALDIYENTKEVMHISGYMYPHKRNLPETFFFNVPLCWGWATWERAWNQYKDNANDHIDYINKNKLWKDFNKFGGKYLERQLRKNKDGSMNTWFIHWHATIFRSSGYCLFPKETLVDNIGFDSSGQHSANTNKFYSPMADYKIQVFPLSLKENKEAASSIRYFYMFKRNSYIKKIKQVFSMIFKK